MILCVSLNPAVDKMLKINSINIGKVNRASVESVHAGGKAVNVAFDLSLQGEEVLLTGFVGGRCGRMILDELKQREMPNKFVMLSTETRTNMNYIDSLGNVTEILEGGHLVDAKSEEEFLHLYMNLVKKAEMVVLSGSLPIGLDDGFYGTLIESLTNHKYDLSPLDIGFEEFFDSASFKNVMLEDLKDLQDLGIAIICVTLGKKGMLLFAKDQIIICDAPEVEVVNTVGSGDCTLAALIHSLIKKVSLRECAIYASAVSSAHVNTMNVGDIDPDLVSELTGKVKYGIFKCPEN